MDWVATMGMDKSVEPFDAGSSAPSHTSAGGSLWSRLFGGAPPPKKTAADSDDDDDDDPSQPEAADEALPPAAKPTRATLPLPEQLDSIFDRYADFKLANIRPDALTTSDTASGATSMSRVTITPEVANSKAPDVINDYAKATEKAFADVLDGPNKALESVINVLFKGELLTDEVKEQLRMVVIAAHHPSAAPAIYEKNSSEGGKARRPNERAAKELKARVSTFYMHLIDAIKVVSIHCAKEAKKIPADSKDRRRYLLMVWKSVLADLRSLQNIYAWGIEQQVLDLGGGEQDIAPVESLMLREVDTGRIQKRIGASERRLHELKQQLDEYCEEERRLNKRYLGIEESIQLEEASRDAMLTKLRNTTDICLMAANAVAHMKSSIGRH